MKRKNAFTLIELLIVVAIIAILAAIAVPNFLEAQIRSKVSRAKSDMRSVATALEAYRTDFNNYPPITQIPGYNVPRNITTPVAYIASIPIDPFGESVKDCLYYPYGTTKNYYYATKKYFDDHNWVWRVYPIGSNNPALWDFLSKGPDRRFARSLANGGCGVDEVDSPYYSEYDPTNGTISVGNVIRSGP